MNNKFTIVTDILVRRNNKYLLCKSNESNYYELPGAHLLDGYEPIEFCKLCLKNQINYTADVSLELKHVMFYDKGKKVYLTYMCDIIDEIVLNNEFYDTCIWIDIEEIEKYVNDKLYQTIDNIINNNLYSSFRRVV